MDRADAVRLLPEKHARALTLHDQGWDDTRIAAALEMEPESIGMLLRVAKAKLQQLLDNPPKMDKRLEVPLDPPESPRV